MGGDTIFALATPRGRSAIAIVRVSGPATRFGLETLAGRVPTPRMASLLRLVAPRTLDNLDQALVLWFPGPASFTGEDMAELHLHGGRAVVDGVLAALLDLGYRPAAAGEFTRRAFANGKAGLTAIEGLADLIEAETAAQRRQALRQMSGELARLVDAWRISLIEAMARIEADLDFSDEGDVADSLALEMAKAGLERVAAEMDRVLAGARRSERLRDGLVAVLAGPPNAGKSTLMNALAGRDVAIVSETPGTTRDVIEVALDLDGVPLTIVDTAGLREAVDGVEREGIRRTRDRLATADVVVWLTPAAAPEPCPAVSEDTHVLSVATKIDSQSKSSTDRRLGLSARTGEGLDSLTEQLTALASNLAGEASLLTRMRHRDALTRARSALGRAIAGLEPHRLELAAEDLRLSVRALEALIGRVDVEDVLDRLFASFCIGK